MAKILLQNLCLEHLTWVESIPIRIHTQWIVFRQELELLNNLEIHKHVRCIMPIHTELHKFSDARENAYGALAYVRKLNMDGIMHVSILLPKSRVAPLKSITAPRLELCGALIAVKLL